MIEVHRSWHTKSWFYQLTTLHLAKSLNIVMDLTQQLLAWEVVKSLSVFWDKVHLTSTIQTWWLQRFVQETWMVGVITLIKTHKAQRSLLSQVLWVNQEEEVLQINTTFKSFGTSSKAMILEEAKLLLTIYSGTKQLMVLNGSILSV